MKKLLSLFLVMLIAVSLTACTDNKKPLGPTEESLKISASEQMEFLKNGLETMSKQEIDRMIRENRDNNNSLLKYANDNVITEGTNYENWQNKINKVSAEQAFFTVSFEFYGEGTGANYPQQVISWDGEKMTWLENGRNIRPKQMSILNYIGMMKVRH